MLAVGVLLTAVVVFVICGVVVIVVVCLAMVVVSVVGGVHLEQSENHYIEVD